MIASLLFVFSYDTGFSGDERQISCVTGPRRFPPLNHAKNFQKALRQGKGGRRLPQSKTLRESQGVWRVRQVLDCASHLALWLDVRADNGQDSNCLVHYCCRAW